MTEEQLKQYLVIVKNDTSHHEKLKTAGGDDAIVVTENTAVYMISEEELEVVTRGFILCLQIGNVTY